MASGMVELIALKPFAHSIGTVDIGQSFRVSRQYGQSLIDAKIARLAGRSAPAPKAARWAGAKVVIIASGPSLMQEDLEMVRRWRAQIVPEMRKVVVINTTFLAAPWADLLYSADFAWWHHYAAEVKEVFQGECWTQSEPAKKNYGLNYVTCERRVGLSAIPGVIHSGGNSGYQSIGLTASFGASEIVLLAFDMQRTGGVSHHHGDHPKELRQSSPFATWLRSFKALSKDLKSANIRVVNASRSTALEDFDRVPLDEALGMTNA